MTPLLTTADVMRELGVSLSTAKRLVARLPQIRIGRSVRVRREDFDRYLRVARRGPLGGRPSRWRLRAAEAEVERLRAALFPIATGRFASVSEACDIAEAALGAEAVAVWNAAENARAALGEP